MLNSTSLNFDTRLAAQLTMNKAQILDDILDYLNQELNNTLIAAKNAHLAATDDQSIAETQYDTIAIEASYLAQGQSKRVQEIQAAVRLLKQMPLSAFDHLRTISVGALVQLEQNDASKHWFFIAPAAGGYRGKIDDQDYTVITPNSPMAKALLGKLIDDEINITLGQRKLSYLISAIY